jgi:hypothetical protein
MEQKSFGNPGLPCSHKQAFQFFHSLTVHLDISQFFIYQLMHKKIALKRILTFTLKQLLHVSVQSPSSGSALFELAKITVVGIIN